MSEDVVVVPLRGVLADPLHFEVIRQLVPDDLKDLINAPVTSVPVLQKLRAIHHRQAVLVAEGRTNNEVAAIVGSTPQRISQLKNDPAFQNLVSYYQDQIITAQLEDGARLKDKLVDLSEMAVDEMRERMEDDSKRQAMPVGEVRKIAEFGLDRTVLPPKSTTSITTQPQTITLDFGGKGFREVEKKPMPMIDITPEPNGARSPTSPQPQAQDSPSDGKGK